jgi:hypothetical protein
MQPSSAHLCNLIKFPLLAPPFVLGVADGHGAVLDINCAKAAEASTALEQGVPEEHYSKKKLNQGQMKVPLVPRAQAHSHARTHARTL